MPAPWPPWPPASCCPRPRSRCRAGSNRSKIKWSKAPCRFCGTGCGVMVGVKENRVVATHGDMLSEVNRGLNCVKGYFLSKIMYGADRLTQPLLRMRNGRLRQGRRVHPGDVGRGVRRDGRAGQARPEGEGTDRARHVHVRAVHDLGRLRRHQADARRFPLQQPRSQCATLHGLGGVCASCAPSAWTSRWAATTISSRPMRSCCGARTWRRCIRSCGRA